MPRKNVLIQAQTIEAASMAASYTGAATNIAYLDNVMIQLNWSGAPVGTFAVEISNDYQQDAQGNVVNAGNWHVLTVSPALAAPAGSASSTYTLISNLGAPWIRVVYTRTSGTGALDMYITAKEI